MIFNTGSALLDAIVLAVVSREPEGTYGYKITQELPARRSICRNRHCTRCFADCKKTAAWKSTIWNSEAGTGGIIALRSKEARSFRCMKRNGFDILRR